MKSSFAALGAAAVFLATVVFAVSPADSASMDEIDCSSSPFSFAGEGYQVDCERSSTQVRAGESSGATQVDVITVSGSNPHMFMTVISTKINAPRIYLEHRNLRESFRDVFGIEAEDWEGVGSKGGYDMAEFKADISGMPSWCIAIQRYTNPAWTGYKRHVVGMGCSPLSREPVYAALPKLHAPGD